MAASRMRSRTSAPRARAGLAAGAPARRVAGFCRRPRAFFAGAAGVGRDAGLRGVGAVDARSRLLDADKYLDEQIDPYVFLRTAYLQNRQNLVFDGNPPKPKFDFDEE